MTKLKFIAHSLHQGIATDDHIEADSLVLFYDTWDDFGYKVTFDLLCASVAEMPTMIHIGRTRIFHSESDLLTDWPQLSLSRRMFTDYPDGEGLDAQHFFSLATRQSFYTDLYDYSPDKYEEMLKLLCDLTMKTSSERQALLEAESVDDWGNDIFDKVIFRQLGSKPRDILQLQQVLQTVDNRLTVGNYLEWDNFQKLLNTNDVFIFEKIVNYFDNDSAYAKLDNIVKNFTESGEMLIPDDRSQFILDLLDKGDYSQLKARLESFLDENLKTIQDAVQVIKAELRYNPNPNDAPIDFVHYTTLSTLDILIKRTEDKPQLRLSNTRQLNDPNEGYTLLELIGLTQAENTEVDYETSPFFLSSMAELKEGSDIDDSLPMWKQYGGDATGVSLTYHPDFIRTLVDVEDLDIFKVVYKGAISQTIQTALDEIKQAIVAIGDDNIKLANARVFIEPIRYLFKEGSYSYENEYRIIRTYEGKSDKIQLSKFEPMPVPRLYTYIEEVPLKYAKVILGPKAEDIDFIAPYIKHIDHTITVKKSKIPFR